MNLRDNLVALPMAPLWVTAEACCVGMTILKKIQGGGGRVYVSWKP